MQAIFYILIWVAFNGIVYLMEKSIKCTLEICALLCVYTKSQCKGLFGDEGGKSFHKKVWEEKQVSVSNIDYFTFLNILNIL